MFRSVKQYISRTRRDTADPERRLLPSPISFLDNEIIAGAKNDLKQGDRPNLTEAVIFLFYTNVGGGDSFFSFDSICRRNNVDPEWLAQQIFKKSTTRIRARISEAVREVGTFHFKAEEEKNVQVSAN